MTKCVWKFGIPAFLKSRKATSTTETMLVAKMTMDFSRFFLKAKTSKDSAGKGSQRETAAAAVGKGSNLVAE